MKEKVLGPYLVKLPVSILTENQRNTNSTSASPAIARAEGTREAITEETETNIELRGGVIKRFTGNDSFYARKLHDNGGEIKLTFKLILICNNVPIIPNADQAVKNRLIIIPFLSTWVDKNSHVLPKSRKKQYKHRIFPSDPLFCTKLSRMAPAFLWVMVQYYPIYRKEGLVPPEIIRQHTESYWKVNDFYATYINDNIEVMLDEEGSPDHDYSVEVGKMYQDFRIWYRSSGCTSPVPDRINFTNEMSNKWDRPNGGKWTSIRLKNKDDDDNAACNDFSKPSLPSFSSSSQKMTKPKESRL
jgi:phage/plasmid-associated DNA primase